jgi:hypothetical protein
MKRFVTMVVFLALVATASALPLRTAKHSLVEFGPKASLYIGSVRFGMGAELVFNPMRNLGIRMDVAEFSFGNNHTEFYMNYGGSLDALIHFPTRDIHPYFFGGLGLVSFTNMNSDTYFAFRFGLGVEHAWDRNTNVFLEPGLIIASIGDGDTKTTFRLSAGARLGILR